MNASADRRRDIIRKIAELKDVAERISSRVKSELPKGAALKSLKITKRLPSLAERATIESSPEFRKKQCHQKRLEGMLKDFYAPDESARRQVPDPWAEDEKYMDVFRKKLAMALSKSKRNKK